MAWTGTTVETLEKILREQTEAGTLPWLSVSVVKGDRLVWTRGFGFPDLAPPSWH